MSLKITKHENLTDIDLEKTENLKHFSIYHTKKWANVLKTTFNWNVKAITATKDGELVFYLPYVNKTRFDLKKYNIALPLSHNLGPALNNNIDKDSFNKIIDEISDLGNFEIHNKIKSEKLIASCDHTLTTLKFDQFSSIEGVFSSLNKSSIQRKIKKARKEGVIVEKESSLKSYKIFTNLQNKTRQRQGSPAYPRSYFDNIHKYFKGTGSFNLYLAYHNKSPVAGVLFTNFKGVAIYGYGASLYNRDILRLGVNQLAMWEAIKDAYESGCHAVDFGRTPLSLVKLQQYKEKWGSNTEQLYYSFTKDRKIAQIDRDGPTTKTISFCLQNCPYVIFSNLSPYLLKLAL